MIIIDKNTPPIPQEIGFWDAATSKLTAIVGSLGQAISTLTPLTASQSRYSTMAANAQKYVNTNILFSSSFPKRNNHFDANNSRSVIERFQGVNEAITEVRSSLGGSSSFKLAIDMGMKALKYSIGNCMEMSAAAFVYLLNIQPEIKIDLYNIKGGDHCFLVLGRDFDSDPADHKTWGENAFICDPWSKKSFPASQIENLKDFVCTMTSGRTVLRDLDLNTQTLEIWASNQYTTKDLEYLAGPEPKSYVVEMIKILAPLLQHFYGEKDLEKKKEAAETIQIFLEKIPFKQNNNPSIIAFQKARAALYDQLDFFLTNCTSS